MKTWKEQQCRKKLIGKKLLIFDFDGTLFDLNADWEELKQELENFFQIRCPDIPFLSFQSMFRAFNYLKENCSAQIIQECLNKVRETEKKAALNHASPRPLITRGLDVLKPFTQTEPRFGIVSNNFQATVNQTLQRYQLTSSFVDVLGRDDVPEMKPNPEGILKIIGKNKAEKNESIYLGDVESDQVAATRAGVEFLYIQDLETLLDKEN